MKKLTKHILSLAVVMCLTMSTTANASSRDEESVKTELFVTYDSGRLVVKGIEERTRIEITNMLGVKIYSGIASSSDRNEFSVSLRKGIYIVRAGGEVKRIAVR